MPFIRKKETGTPADWIEVFHAGYSTFGEEDADGCAIGIRPTLDKANDFWVYYTDDDFGWESHEKWKNRLKLIEQYSRGITDLQLGSRCCFRFRLNPDDMTRACPNVYSTGWNGLEENCAILAIPKCGEFNVTIGVSHLGTQYPKTVLGYCMK